MDVASPACALFFSVSKGQTGQRWAPREIYQGSGLQWLRTGPMMTLYFCLFDACTRHSMSPRHGLSRNRE